MMSDKLYLKILKTLSSLDVNSKRVLIDGSIIDIDCSGENSDPEVLQFIIKDKKILIFVYRKGWNMMKTVAFHELYNNDDVFLTNIIKNSVNMVVSLQKLNCFKWGFYI